MNSKYLCEGALVNVQTPKSHISFKKLSVLEVHECGIVTQQKDAKTAPIRFFSWDKIEDLEIIDQANMPPSAEAKYKASQEKGKKDAAPRT